MFHVALDLGGMVCEGFRLLSLSISLLPSEVDNLNVVGLFEIVVWATSYHITAQRFYGRTLPTKTISRPLMPFTVTICAYGKHQYYTNYNHLNR